MNVQRLPVSYFECGNLVCLWASAEGPEAWKSSAKVAPVFQLYWASVPTLECCRCSNVFTSTSPMVISVLLRFTRSCRLTVFLAFIAQQYGMRHSVNTLLLLPRHEVFHWTSHYTVLGWEKVMMLPNILAQGQFSCGKWFFWMSRGYSWTWMVDFIQSWICDLSYEFLIQYSFIIMYTGLLLASSFQTLRRYRCSECLLSTCVPGLIQMIFVTLRKQIKQSFALFIV